MLKNKASAEFNAMTVFLLLKFFQLQLSLTCQKANQIKLSEETRENQVKLTIPESAVVGHQVRITHQN